MVLTGRVVVRIESLAKHKLVTASEERIGVDGHGLKLESWTFLNALYFNYSELVCAFVFDHAKFLYIDCIVRK